MMQESGNAPPLDDLIAEFKQLEGSGATATTTGLNDSKYYLTLFKNYGIYLIFFIYTFILIIALQPFHLYQKDEEGDKYKFLWKRFIIVFIISYSVLVGIYLFFKYYFK